MKFNPIHSILKVLSPRHDIGTPGSAATASAAADKKRKKRSGGGGGGSGGPGGGGEDGNYRHPIFLSLSAVQLSDPQVCTNAQGDSIQTVFLFSSISAII